MAHSRIALLMLLSVPAVRAQQATWNLPFAPPFPYAGYWSAVADYNAGRDIGDLNGDGMAEIAASGQPLVFSGANGAVIYDGLSVGETSKYKAGDFDADGVEDMIDHALVGGVAQWRVSSGISGVTIASMPLGSGLDRVYGVGDVNGDGYDDVGQGYFAGLSYGYVSVFLGPDLSYWGTVSGIHALRNWGMTVMGVGDVTGDGFDDFLVGGDGYWWASQPPGGVGYVSLISGATMTHVQQFYGTWTHERFGRAVNAMGDLNADGFPDFAIDSLYNVRIVSGATLTDLYATTNGNAVIGAMPRVYGVGDVDRDGADDYVGRRFGGALLAVFSGRTMSEIWNFGWPFPLAPGAVTGFPMGITPIGDADGDGYPDIACGFTPGAAAPPSEPPRFVAFSLRPNGVAHFGAGCSSAGQQPRIGVSGAPRIGKAGALNLSGALPGSLAFLVLGGSNGVYQGVPLPLDLGIYGSPGCQLLSAIDWSAAVPTEPPGTLGGFATVPMAIPATSSLVGGTLYAQWLIVEDPTFGAGWLSTSDAVSLTIQP